MPFENIMGKGENAGNHQNFSHNVFYPIKDSTGHMKCNYFVVCKSLKTLSFGKESSSFLQEHGLNSFAKWTPNWYNSFDKWTPNRYNSFAK